MIGKIAFVLGIAVFIAAIVAAVLQGMQHTVITSQPVATLAQQYLDMARQLWLVEAFALGFVLVGSGLLLWGPKSDE